jgi:hypothetical protein
MTDTLLVKSSEIQLGDVVLAHGMRVLIDRPARTYPSPQGPEGNKVCYSYVGLVLNLDDVREAGVVPISWLYSDTDTEPRWNVQGNDYADWMVERA